MKIFQASVGQVLFRFYLMMAVIIIGLFTGQYWMIVLGFPIFLFGLLGVSVDWKKMFKSKK